MAAEPSAQVWVCGKKRAAWDWSTWITLAPAGSDTVLPDAGSTVATALEVAAALVAGPTTPAAAMARASARTGATTGAGRRR